MDKKSDRPDGLDTMSGAIESIGVADIPGV